MSTFAQGQRVRLSPLGLEHLWRTKPERAAFRGTVKGRSMGGTLVRIKWDHWKSAATYGPAFIEAADDEPPCAAA